MLEATWSFKGEGDSAVSEVSSEGDIATMLEGYLKEREMLGDAGNRCRGRLIVCQLETRDKDVNVNIYLSIQ